MTMVNSTVSSAPSSRGGGVSLRKTNKPLMEKRRRARINDSLSQLKSLVIHSSKKDSSQFSKLEKADILELTVKHLRGLQAHQQQQHRSQHPMGVPSSVPGGPADTLVNGKYRAGFVECANEVIRYLDQAQGLNQETKSKVVSHLANCLQLVSSSQSKIAPAPQPIPQPTTAAPPPVNAAAILAAAAVAAGNGPAVPAAQPPYGQIIQIVSNPLQALPNASGPTVLGLNPNPTPSNIQGISLSAHSEQVSCQPKNMPIQPVSKATQQNQSANAQSAYIHYAQPLHIQIPPIVSPVLVKKCPVAKEAMEPKESNNSFSSSSSSSHSSNQSSPPEQVHDVVSSTSLAPSPRHSTSPPSLYPGHPKARAQKQLNFYMQDLKCDKYYKSGKHPLTPTSSSSSSSESENTSPLNLSQSPPFSAFKSDQKRPVFKSVPQKLNYDPKPSVCPYPTKSSSARLESHFGLASNTTSVIVNSRKCADFSEGRYWSMMEEDRLCLRQRNTPSPASSVGEERLWRPW